jgi:hypothetical protein
MKSSKKHIGKGKKMVGPQRFMKGGGKHSFNIENGKVTPESSRKSKRGRKAR